MHEFGVVILAAGASRRLGRPKQLVEVSGRTLLELACEAAVGSGARQVVLVVGAFGEEISSAAKNSDGQGSEIHQTETVLCPDWEEGMAASIRTGVKSLRADLQSLVIMLCDQPFVSASHIQELSAQVSALTPIVASRYEDGTLGVPCAFHRSQFSALIGLQGDKGARELIRSSEVPVGEVLLPRSEDLDTTAHIEALQGS